MQYHMIEPDPSAGLSEGGKLVRSLPNSVERQTFMGQDYVQLEGLLSETFADALSGEARNVFSVTHQPDSEQPADPIESSGQATEVLAPLLRHLHLSLVPLARALTGQVLVPAHAWYNFYTSDDHMWLHIDSGSELVLLTTALGQVGPLHLHPELRGKTQAELEIIQRDPAWEPESGVPVDYPRLGLLAHRGHVVPHHRPGHPVSEPCAVAALHYLSLF